MPSRALVIVPKQALAAQQSGATRRLQTILRALGDLHIDFDVAPVSRRAPVVSRALVVGVFWPTLRSLEHAAALGSPTWFDACDSPRLVRAGALQHRQFAQGLALMRDHRRAARFQPGLVTYSAALDRDVDLDLWRESPLVMCNDSRAVAVSTGEAPYGSQLPGRRRLVFVGGADYFPNREAVQWILSDLVPTGLVSGPIRSRCSFHIYGEGWSHVRHPDVQVHGYAQSDAELYRAGDIHLAPMVIGAGVPNKVTEPLASGLDVLATPLAARSVGASQRLRISTRTGFIPHLERILAEEHLSAAISPVDHTVDEREQVARAVVALTDGRRGSDTFHGTSR